MRLTWHFLFSDLNLKTKHWKSVKCPHIWHPGFIKYKAIFFLLYWRIIQPELHVISVPLCSSKLHHLSTRCQCCPQALSQNSPNFILPYPPVDKVSNNTSTCPFIACSSFIRSWHIKRKYLQTTQWNKTTIEPFSQN